MKVVDSQRSAERRGCGSSNGSVFGCSACERIRDVGVHHAVSCDRLVRASYYEAPVQQCWPVIVKLQTHDTIILSLQLTTPPVRLLTHILRPQVPLLRLGISSLSQHGCAFPAPGAQTHDGSTRVIWGG